MYNGVVFIDSSDTKSKINFIAKKDIQHLYNIWFSNNIHHETRKSSRCWNHFKQPFSKKKKDHFLMISNYKNIYGDVHQKTRN